MRSSININELNKEKGYRTSFELINIIENITLFFSSIKPKNTNKCHTNKYHLNITLVLPVLPIGFLHLESFWWLKAVRKQGFWKSLVTLDEILFQHCS